MHILFRTHTIIVGDQYNPVINLYKLYLSDNELSSVIKLIYYIYNVHNITSDIVSCAPIYVLCSLIEH